MENQITFNFCQKKFSATKTEKSMEIESFEFLKRKILSDIMDLRSNSTILLFNDINLKKNDGKII